MLLCVEESRGQGGGRALGRRYTYLQVNILEPVCDVSIGPVERVVTVSSVFLYSLEMKGRGGGVVIMEEWS